MKTFFMLMTIFLIGCSSQKPATWDGAQRQETMKDENRQQQQQQFRNQFPGRGNF